MADKKGDPDKKRASDCTDFKPGTDVCPHLQETGGGFEGERYECEKCGERFFLDYEDMK